ncbi:hypothetical protein SPF06_00855 [Sinomonas sp. JGH33]|uniref:KOW domain-containing protein n=1 Tax=Sinomonas terricola TaxID=3110330 RepID=A0ABU5T0T0_9MICC|nr:hypothetical protein [Sinomonas sp. JGH33]MEA5453259.1 hypothetical protein [Sinomonas sp. JGH33]
MNAGTIVVRGERIQIKAANGWAGIGSRIVVIGGRSSDDPDYRGATGTVVAVHAGPLPIEVELDHFGWSACFAPERIEVIPE